MKNKSAKARMKELRHFATAMTFLAPSMAGVLLFSLIPLIISLYVSMTDWNYTAGLFNWEFIGMENFKNLVTDTWFLSSLKNTFIFTIVTVPIGIFLAAVLAVLIDRFCNAKVASVVRVSMYMPHICNIVATSAVWMALYSSYGPFTNMVRNLGWKTPPKWLSDYTWALPALMLVVVWAGLGYRIFLYSASIVGLPKDIYESASLDGANGRQTFWYITLPLLKPTTFFLTITGIIGSFKVFGYTNVMTKGGPGSSTYTLVYYIYKSAFEYKKMGYASAIAVVMFLFLLVIMIIQWVHNSKDEK
jgi:multiple sugar transport system permease protein